MRLVLVVIVAVVLAGCALDLSGTAWKKPDAMFQQVTAVEMECARQTYEIGYGPDPMLGGLLDVLRLALNESRLQVAFASCMSRAGYARAG
jgi:hypothetical protein